MSDTNIERTGETRTVGIDELRRELKAASDNARTLVWPTNVPADSVAVDDNGPAAILPSGEYRRQVVGYPVVTQRLLDALGIDETERARDFPNVIVRDTDGGNDE